MSEIRFPEIVAAIIAGGAAKRFGGRAKPLIELGGRTIIEAQLSVLRPMFGDVVLSTNDAAPYQHLGLRTIADAPGGHGPLAGIAAVLEQTGARWLFVVGGDMPALQPAALELIASHTARGDTIDAVAPFIDDRPEPLLAVYGAGALPVMQRRLAEARFRLSWLLTSGALRVAKVNGDDLRAADPDLSTLVNINTPDELLALERLDS